MAYDSGSKKNTKNTSESSPQSSPPSELQDRQLDPQPIIQTGYNPNKRNRLIRRTVYQRFYWLRDDPARKDAEADWEIADKEFQMYVTPRDTTDPNNWRADLHLPDSFAAIQSQEQERIERKSRPSLIPTEASDEPISEFGNAILTYNMNSTGYDYQYYLAKLSAASRGTAFLCDYYRVDKRTVKYPDSLDADGKIVYIEKEIIDFDDDYTEWIPNEFIYVDERARHIDDAVDCIKREILNIDEFHRCYDDKPGYFDTENVYAGGDTSNLSFFRLPKDITYYDVEILHYYNRSTDSYWVVANNVTVYDSPLPSKHKELPIAVIYQYRIPGLFYGMGIPKVIHMLSEERRTIRNMNLDRQKIIIGGAFLHNSSYDIDDEDTVLSPGKIISVDTNGQDVNGAIRQLDLGDVPASSFKTEDTIQEDIRRGTGIDDRIQGVNVGGTATEAAILKESSLKRVNLISITAEMDAVIRIGKLKWSNIQFFYSTPRIEKVLEDNEEREEKVYRTISVQGKKFSIVNDDGRRSLRMEDVKGMSSLKLDKSFSKYMDKTYDIMVNADIFTPISKAIEQTKKTEIYGMLLSNPATMAVMDIQSATADILKVNNIKPETWLKQKESSKDWQMLAEAENMIMSAGQPLGGTDGATEDHTLIHLMYTKTADFQALAPEIQQIIMDHILQEHDKNPATGSSADLLQAHGLGAPGVGGPAPGPTAGIQAPPTAQVADLQPTNFATPPGQ